METVEVARRSRFFYGWWIVLVSAIVGFMNTGTSIWGFSVFIKPMTEDLGWSRTLLTGAYFWRIIIGALPAPLFGPFIDRKKGARYLLLIGGIVTALSTMAIRQVNSPWQFYLVFGVFSALGTIGYGFMVPETLVAKWFIKKRGRAMGFSAMGIAFGAVFMPPLANFLISALGWRDAWVVMGLLILLSAFPCAYLARRSPEDMGLLPDGAPLLAPAPSSPQPSTTSPREQIFTLREAIRTPTLWLLLVAVNLAWISMTALGMNWASYYQDIGFSREVAVLGVTVYGIFAALGGRVIWGLAAERFHVRYCVIIQGTLTALGLIILININSLPLLFFYTFFHGLTLGGFPVLQPLLWANYYGRTFLGAIRGFITPFTLFSMAGGAPLANIIFDATGSYRMAFIIFIFTWLACAGIMLLARPAKRTRVG